MTLFSETQKTAIIAELRANRLVLAGSPYFQAAKLSDDYLYRKLLAAEADAARRLRVLFEPTTIFAGQPTAEEIAALGDAPWLEEPGYDYDPDMYSGDRWALISTRQAPIISISKYEYLFPTPVISRFVVPPEWLRVDKKYGQIRVVPSGASGGSPVSLFLMQSMGGGRSVPQMIHLRYVAGLANAARDFPDLMDLIQWI